ncbi:KilA-N domain-containing protein [Dyadobacter sp. OTU695]|uniref:KilA-N domain-containing protein n=1 Tax=Dyadobacter sp. OTU695 TaxID=3043860 RepID=UPI00406BF988
MKNQKLVVKNQEIGILSRENSDYISLTDIARQKDRAPGLVIANWMRNRFTIEFNGLWEQLHNPAFNILEFENVKSESGSNSYVLTSKHWIEKPMRSVSYRNQEDITVEHSRIATSLSNLPRGFHRLSSSI